jgi:hypothetical protein
VFAFIAFTLFHNHVFILHTICTCCFLKSYFFNWFFIYIPCLSYSLQLTHMIFSLNVLPCQVFLGCHSIVLIHIPYFVHLFLSAVVVIYSTVMPRMVTYSTSVNNERGKLPRKCLLVKWLFAVDTKEKFYRVTGRRWT